MKLDADHRRLLDLLDDHAPLSLLINLLVPVLLSVPLMHEVPLYVLVWWCVSAAVVGLIRFLLLLGRQGHTPGGGTRVWSMELAYLVFTVIQGLVWGIGGVVLLEATTGLNQVLVLALIAGMSAGAIPVLGAMLPAYTGYLLCTTLPVAAWLFSQGGAQFLTLGAIGCVFIYSCFVGATRINRLLIRSLLVERRPDRPPAAHGEAEQELNGSAQSRPQLQSEARERAKMEQVITTLSAGFVRLTVGEIDDGIRQALARLGSYAPVDRSYVYLFRGEDTRGSISHQWCRQGVSPGAAQEFYDLALSMDRITRGRSVYFASPDDLPVEAGAERDFFTRRRLKSWVAVPLITEGQARGFLGFDALETEIRWNDDITALLRIGGAALMNALERKRDEALIQSQAYQDPLTSLPNRRRFMARMEQTYKECRRHDAKAAILFIDVDYFKNINDSLGHAAGDALLKHIADRLQSGLRGGDMACRLGGDEFIILLTDLGRNAPSPEQAAFALARRVHRELSLPYDVSGREVNITMSMGVEIFPSQSRNFEAVISNADSAMYRAKNSGRNFIQLFEPDMYDSAKSRLQLDRELRDALRLDKFELHAQPQVNAHGDVITDELLLRWNSDRQGIVECKDFIADAEDLGLISEIDEWVVNHACEVVKRHKMLNRGQKLTYAINVSSRQFLDREFAHMVSDALGSAGLSGGFLELELGESIFRENRPRVLKSMNSLRAMGVRIVLDGFGEGPSSLSSLKYLPFDKVKIDQSFVRGVENSGDAAAIVDAVIAIGDRFEFEVVAEGVENEAQFELLQSRGVGLFQGHFFGRPRPLVLDQTDECAKPSAMVS